MTPDTISASRIQAYLRCPRQYAFKYVEQVPPEWKPAALAFGSAVHAALEAFHRERLAGKTPESGAIVELFRVDWHAALADDLLRFKDDESPTALADLGSRLVAAYLAAVPDLAVAAVEEPFEVPLEDGVTGEVVGPDLKGIFDVVLEGDVVLEIKTAARSWDEGTQSRNLQLTAYAYAYRQMCGTMPRLRLAVLLKQRQARAVFSEVQRTEEEVAWFVHLAAEVARGIEAGLFPPNPGWPCDGCEWQRPCAAWRGRSMVLPPQRGAEAPCLAEAARLVTP